LGETLTAAIREDRAVQATPAVTLRFGRQFLRFIAAHVLPVITAL
jgi:hypothetical protein